MSGTGEDIWQQHRRAMLAETERFIEWGLRHPELVNWIPAKPVASGGFPRKGADWFYATVLSDVGGRRTGHWRRKLRSGVQRITRRGR